MKCIVPLAGPDLFDSINGFRPLVLHGGIPILTQALNRRAWRHKLRDDDFVFVVRDVAEIRTLKNALGFQWPGCRVVELSQLTQGALLTVVAGLAMVGDDEPVIVDLADILFSEGPQDPAADLGLNVGAIVPVFRSTSSAYSYLRSENGVVVEAAEKRVISDAASAGVYMFKDVVTLLEATAHSIRHRDALAYRGSLYVAPAVNGVLALGMSVLAPWLSQVEPTGKPHLKDASM